MTLEPATVAVVCAMDSEAVHLRRRLEGPREEPLARWRRTRGTIGTVPVDVIVCGIGLINAAAATSALCTLAPPAAIINYGCSGAHRDDIDPGDVVIASHVVHFSSLIVLPDGARRYEGFRYFVDYEEVLADRLAPAPALLERAIDVAKRVELPEWDGVGHQPQVLVGTVGSADIWTQHGESIRDLHTIHGSLCEEMEAAAIAQVAATWGVPFLAIKDISNNELRQYTDMEIEGSSILAHVVDEVGRRAALIV
ncbi:MAG TPA: 5'-methylthioadenosine/S-adenosylhomocysteine nucleosidase, partial [Thermomicrobiales bacterium]|nr:5'-methylthioadenosine/S-adenosylhomocysteine nucleosidase [Thermomicrobiales bacterium]